MIAQLLNRQFIIEQLADIQDQLREDAGARRAGGKGGDDLAPEDYQTALARVQESLEAERARSSGQPGFEPPPPERRNEWPADLDDFAFISRDPIVNIVQSALESYFTDEANPQGLLEEEPSDDRRSGPDDEPAVTNQRLPESEPRRGENNRRIFDPFSVTDIGWVSSLVAMGIRKLRSRHAFNDTRPAPVEVGPDARIILVGDWGSGIPRAQKVATAMRVYVEEGRRNNRDTHVVHLGDVYYSGWEFEYRKRFLRYWPVRDDEAGNVGSWSLNGNHDMYSGGFGYFDVLLADARFAKQQRNSFFHLRNEDWTILGLDTAWDDDGLKDPQGGWASQIVGADRRKTMLLSHHQLLSAYEEGPKLGKAMREKLAPLLQANRIHAAFWGHEHRCVLYDAAENVQYPRLIGHGGVPVYMTRGKSDPYPPPAHYEYRDEIVKGLEHWAVFGFAVLDFAGPAITVRYVNEYGETHREERIV